MCYILLFCSATVYSQDLNSSDLYATYCAVIDSETGRTLFVKDADKQVPMASTTKILTCILVLEYGNLNDYALTSKYAASMPKVHMGARAGEYYLVEDLLYALMLESFNDAAVILAEYLCGDVASFALMMNEKAKEIGCKNYNFVTPNGLDGTNESGQHSITASDLAKIMAYCTTISANKEDFLRITTTTTHLVRAYEKQGKEYVPNGHEKNCLNRNSLLNNANVISGKTGFTNKAGYCYVCQTMLNNHPVSFAILACGWPNNKGYKWVDSKKIMEYISNNYNDTEIHFPEVEQEMFPAVINAKKTIGIASPVCPGVLLVESSATYFMSEEDEVRYIFQIDDTITAPMKEGSIVGELYIYINEEHVDTVSLYLSAQIEKNTYSKCLGEVFKAFMSKVINIAFLD